MRTAVSSRDLVGQDKGTLVERVRLTADDSFLLLVEVSQSTHRRVVDVARELAETGTVPGWRPAGSSDPGAARPAAAATPRSRPG
ncbi:ANTAR domain-containing protein [Geodermatophilus maliterrae]|uniref:ANTAR domain-containing protein n=1 Tax=Geodermatophilus maliterrae TaxID=3162531 RepID=A0ABV3XF04_9ACTN